MAPVTDPAEQSRKLAQIASLDRLQLQGWMQTAMQRGFFPDERAALMKREKQVSK